MNELITVIEREIPEAKVVNLREALLNDPESAGDYEIIEDLASSAAFSRFDTRRVLAAKALSGFLRSPAQLYKMTTEDEVFLYMTLNGIEKGFFFINSYVNGQAAMEPVPTEHELNALRNWIKD